MKYINLVITDMKRAFGTWRMFISVIGVFVTMSLTLGKKLYHTEDSVWYMMEEAMQGSGMESVILCILPIIAFGISYAEEYECKAEKYWIIRTGTRAYITSKAVVAAITGFITVFLGIGIFVLIQGLQNPFFTSIRSTFVYEAVAAKGNVALAYLLYILHHSFSGSIMAVCGLWFSTIVPNRFCAVAAPMLLNFALLRVTGRISIHTYLNPVYWVNGIYYADTVQNTILIKFVTTITLCIVLSFLAKKNIDRRLMNE